MFKFPLQRLLELRELREQAMARDLANARDVADAQREQHDTLATARDSAQIRVSSAASQGPTIGELVSLTYAATQLGERTDAAREQTEVAEANVEGRLLALTSAAKDRQMLDRLRSKRLGEYRADAAQLERTTMDAIALSRHKVSGADENKENK
ncbi:MAG: flagellar export protein FliJ [Gemmatimonadaceae bacterium]